MPMPHSTHRFLLLLQRSLLVAFFVVAGVFGLRTLVANSCVAVPFASPCTRVLFIGNSYTFVNGLPETFAQLAKSGGHRVETGMAAEGGWKLADHVASPQTQSAIQSGSWHYVVLQEQSQTPSIAQLRTGVMYPAARTLARSVVSVRARPILFLTWAHRSGWPERGLATYEQMQHSISQGYTALGRELNAPVAPVGEAWRVVYQQRRDIELWQPDGSHPSEQGTYLAACVFYATVFGESPEGLPYIGSLPRETAEYLQQVAASTVLDHPDYWNLSRLEKPSTGS